MKNIIHSVVNAIRRCKAWILSVFITYCISCTIGIIMAHSGNQLALSMKDKIVSHSLETSNASINYLNGNRFKAALYDFAGNLFLGSVTQTAIGLGIVIPYVSVSYQGWVGGIVSVDSNHQSRLTSVKSALYYFIVLLLQFLPYSLSIGAGIRWGVETYKLNKGNKIRSFKLDKQSFKDVLWISVLVIPLFFIASCFEFLSPWN